MCIDIESSARMSFARCQGPDYWYLRGIPVTQKCLGPSTLLGTSPLSTGMASSGDCRVFYISSCKFYRLRAVDIVFLVLHTSIAQVLRKNNYENRQTLRRGLISVRLQQRAEHKSSN